MKMSWESIYLLYSVSGQNELLLDWKSTVENMDTKNMLYYGPHGRIYKTIVCKMYLMFF